ncbi:MAG: hypothetical protein FWC64_02730 [Treponema sp.]|nr:hypothetical protein [Treponema sp.]
MKTTLNEYLGRLGLGSPMSDYMIDKERLPHGNTLRQQKKMEKEANAASLDYWERRATAIDEYRAKVTSGEITEKSALEVRIERANGHPDNPSVQAARRRLEKKGVNWKAMSGKDYRAKNN